MSNVTVMSDDYQNIQEVAVKKIKVTRPNLGTLVEEGKNSRVAVAPKVEAPKVQEIEEVKPKVVEEAKVQEMPVEKKERKPLYFSDEPKQEEDFEKKISEMKHEKESYYKNLGNFKIKEERKEPQVTIEAYNDLYSKLKDSVIMAEEISEVNAIVESCKANLEAAKKETIDYSNQYNCIVKLEKYIEECKKLEEERRSMLKNPEHFRYLEKGQNKMQDQLKFDPSALGMFSDSIANILNGIERQNESIDANIKRVNGDLQSLYVSNQEMLKDIPAALSEFSSMKKAVEEKQKSAREKIDKNTRELNDFLPSAVNELKNIYRIIQDVKGTKESHRSAVTNKYNALEKERKTEVGINLNIPEEPVQIQEQPSMMDQQIVQNSIPNLNVFENFRQAASEGGNEAAVGTYDNFMNDFENMGIYGRAR